MFIAKKHDLYQYLPFFVLLEHINISSNISYLKYRLDMSREEAISNSKIFQKI